VLIQLVSVYHHPEKNIAVHFARMQVMKKQKSLAAADTLAAASSLSFLVWVGIAATKYKISWRRLPSRVPFMKAISYESVRQRSISDSQIAADPVRHPFACVVSLHSFSVEFPLSCN